VHLGKRLQQPKSGGCLVHPQSLGQQHSFASGWYKRPRKRAVVPGSCNRIHDKVAAYEVEGANVVSKERPLFNIKEPRDDLDTKCSWVEQRSGTEPEPKQAKGETPTDNSLISLPLSKAQQFQLMCFLVFPNVSRIVLCAAAIATGLFVGNTVGCCTKEKPLKEVSMVEMARDYLAKGDVVGIQVIRNRAYCRVHLRPIAPNAIGSRQLLIRLNSNDICALESRLECLQASLGIEPNNYIPIMFTTDTPWRKLIREHTPLLLMVWGVISIAGRM